jgi:hypothetical protein
VSLRVLRLPALTLLAIVALAATAATLPSRADLRDPVQRRSVVERTIPDTVRFDQEIADGNLVQMTVTNYGFYGNNFFNRSPSLEYPAGRGYEHIVRGGLWVGAHARDEIGEFDGVVSGTVDAAQGPTSPESAEWTPGSKGIVRRSTLPTSPFFDRARAVSEMDLVAVFNDFTPTQAANNAEQHRPMHLEVVQETYQWNFAEFQNVLFVHNTITNRGPVMTNVWVGFYSEFASGNKSAYVNWPPSSGDPGGQGSWFNNKWLVWDGEHNMLREHYCDGPPLPPDPNTQCLLQRAPYWIGKRLLGTRGLAGDATPRQMSLSAWSWAPGNPYRDQDVERFRLMTTGMIQPLDGDSVSPRTGDPVDIFSVGPFPILYRDSSITVDYAIVGGAEVADIQHNSNFAQFAYDHNYILPIPPPAPRVKVVPRNNAVDVYWTNVSESAYDVTSPDPNDFEGYRVYIGEDPDSLARIAQFDLNTTPNDTTGFNTGLTPARFDTTINDTAYQYRYRILNLRNGFRYYAGVTAYDLGNTQITPLESGFSDSLNRIPVVPGPAPGERPDLEPVVFPNPYRVEARWDEGRLIRDHFLWFTNLPERCQLKIYTLSGDLVFETEFDGKTYRGEGARGIFNPANPRRVPTLSGTTFGWNMITREGQAVATGLYMFAIENRANGKRHVGKFLIVKSDRESR